ncbi:hypothetical protein ET445_13715 [Agromyces protaetiae]|uniref:Sulfatase N-terminal domain-containing protein n=1 Tax=Agromyces protaetiae TaxID=2509455 RepID=A0A4P6FEJ0_9MICO|nr:sulfatase-like hydrolase/transferase [Agromyces protaetiae]QAY74226.1 hypothetical protein ET445_13715 [Agromyces protaetiae]
MTDAPVGADRPSGSPLRRFSLAVAIVVLVLLPLAPRAPAALADGFPLAILGVPAESILVLFVLFMVPWRPVRLVLAACFGVVVVFAIVLGAIDAGYREVLDIPFDPLDWQQLGDAFGVVTGAIGAGPAITLVVLIAIATALSIVALAWAVLRVDTAMRHDRGRGTCAIAAVAAVWIVGAATGAHLVPGRPIAAAAAVHAISTSASHSAAGLTAVAALPRQIAADRFRATPGSRLLTGLEGKDVVFAFVESYGRVAVQGTDFSADIRRTLREGNAQLEADGYVSRSAFLTSPTFGGLSWLAHSTLMTGLWVDRQPVYSKVIRSDRLTLSEIFGRAGWHTVSLSPAGTEPWSFGTSFYHFDTLIDASDVGYRGPSFGYALVPDQYTWKHLADEVLAADDRPVMAEVDLLSSHTPWAPLPELVPWPEIGDGSVFGSQAARGESAAEVWKEPGRVREAYARSIRYALAAMLSFLHESDDPDLVLVVLGDHQPATIVTGRDPGHDVPISIISKDPAVSDAIDEWEWEDGVLPGPDAPVWPMSAFRDRFVDAFSRG